MLNEGPVPAVPRERLRELRAAFLSECGWGSARPILDELERRDRLVEQALAGRRQVVLWFEHDLYDQLQLLQLLALVADMGHDPERLELINVGAFEGRPDFHGLGELTPGELESLWPLRRQVTPELVELGRLAWEAVRAPEPTAVESLLAGDTAALPFLAPALRRLLEELPDVESGLSRTERQLLESLAAGPRTPAQAFLENVEREEAPYNGDAWVWRHLAELGLGARPLVTLAGGGAVPAPPPRSDPRTFAESVLALTAAGGDVLAGAADRVALLGIDRWVGGVHLTPDHVWRWDRRAGRVTPPR